MPIVNYNNKSEKYILFKEEEKKYINEIITRSVFRNPIIDKKKKCKKCGEMIDVFLFGTFLDDTTKKRYLNSTCKECARKRAKEWSKNNPEKVLIQLEKQNIERRRDRNIIYRAYGDKCACCGEENTLFLTLDHINNDGNEIRPRNAKGNYSGDFSGYYYKRIIKANFPNDLQLLCWNCNCGKARNKGICPHKQNICQQQ